MTKVNYREQITVETNSSSDTSGQRVITAKVVGDKKLFDAIAMFEEKGCIDALETRLKRVIEEEVCAALGELDSFFVSIAAKRKLSRRRKPLLKLTNLASQTGT